MTTAIEAYQDKPTELTLPPAAYIAQELAAVKAFQLLVRQNLIEGSDYGVIPGTGNKPALFKPGAEKMAKLLGLSDHYEIADKIEDWDRPLFRYVIKCQLRSVRTGSVVSESYGECNSMESKYRWRWLFGSQVPEGTDKAKMVTRSINTRNGPATQYRAESDDIYSQVNTLLKMAQKRALVGAALSAGRLSELFTQDIEDLAPSGEVIEGQTVSAPAGPPPSASDGPRCPTHPGRNPKEWGGKNGAPEVWKCTAKAGDAYCTWTAPRGLSAPEVIEGQATGTPPAEINVAAEVVACAKELGWDADATKAWMKQEGWGTAREALPMLLVMVQERRDLAEEMMAVDVVEAAYDAARAANEDADQEELPF